MNVAVCGTQSFEDYDLLKHKLEYYTFQLDEVVILTQAVKILGTKVKERGASRLAERWARFNWKTLQRYHADPKLKNDAEEERDNEFIADADCLIAFWDGQSPNARDLIAKAKKKGIPVRIVRFTK